DVRGEWIVFHDLDVRRPAERPRLAVLAAERDVEVVQVNEVTRHRRTRWRGDGDAHHRRRARRAAAAAAESVGGTHESLLKRAGIDNARGETGKVARRRVALRAASLTVQ